MSVTRDEAIQQKRLTLLKLIDMRMGREDGRRVAECHAVLLRIIGNILDSPGEPKFRQIKMNSKVFTTTVSKVDGALDFLLESGFTKKVFQFEEYIIIDDTTDESIARGLANLQIAREVLTERTKKIEERKQAAIQNEQRAKKEEEERLMKVRNAIREDQLTRQQKELTQKPKDSIAQPPSNSDWPQPK